MSVEWGWGLKQEQRSRKCLPVNSRAATRGMTAHANLWDCFGVRSSSWNVSCFPKGMFALLHTHTFVLHRRRLCTWPCTSNSWLPTGDHVLRHGEAYSKRTSSLMGFNYSQPIISGSSRGVKYFITTFNGLLVQIHCHPALLQQRCTGPALNTFITLSINSYQN